MDNKCALVGLVGLLTVALVLCATQVQADDKLKELIKTPGIIELRLIEAKVPDLDSLPMQGDSDVFLRVYFNDTKELMCESRVIQDDNSPKVSLELCNLCWRQSAAGL